MIMDMIKFILVIAVPAPRHFGFLVILSFLFVCAGGVSYALYVKMVTGQYSNKKSSKLSDDRHCHGISEKYFEDKDATV